MIMVDVDMPKSCKECYLQDILGCPLVANVPAWQAEIAKCTDRRSEHCPLVEIKDENT